MTKRPNFNRPSKPEPRSRGAYTDAEYDPLTAARRCLEAARERYAAHSSRSVEFQLIYAVENLIAAIEKGRK